MRKILVFVAIFFPALAVPAQVSLRLTLPKEEFLLYESIQATVEITSYAGRTIVLSDTTQSPWLALEVQDEDSRLVQNLAALTNETVELNPGQTVTRTINLTPLFAIRSPQVYRAQAYVTAPGSPTRFVSGWRRIEVTRGVNVWEQTIGLPTSAPDNEEYRTYSLLTRRRGFDNQLFLRVRSEAGGLVYGTLQLGKILAGNRPQARCDATGDCHVLHQIAPRYFHYVHVNPQGEFVERAIFSDFASSPRLVMLSGARVTVEGGEKVYQASKEDAASVNQLPEKTSSPR